MNKYELALVVSANVEDEAENQEPREGGGLADLRRGADGVFA